MINALCEHQRHFELIECELCLESDNTALAMKRLSFRLRKGGVCVIVDNLDAVDPSKYPGQTSHSHGYSHSDIDESSISHAAFSRDYICRIFSDVDLETSFDTVTPQEPLTSDIPGKPKIELLLFMAKDAKIRDGQTSDGDEKFRIDRGLST